MVLGRDKSTLSRELKRNKGERGYRPRQAQEKSEARARSCANSRRIPEAAWTYVEEKINLDWSPEQIAGRMAYEGLETVSHETIYQYVYADKAEGGELYRLYVARNSGANVMAVASRGGERFPTVSAQSSTPKWLTPRVAQGTGRATPLSVQIRAKPLRRW